MQVTFSFWKGLFDGAWVGPEWRGRVGPATRARTYGAVYEMVSNTMFYVDRLHKLVWQRNAVALIF